MSTAAKKKKKKFVARTPLVRRLLQIRQEAIANGMKLLSRDEILEEVRRNRGEIEDCDD